MGELKKYSVHANGFMYLDESYGTWAIHSDATAEIARLKAEVERAKIDMHCRTVEADVYRRSCHALEAQLAELRARVRPGVEEIVGELYANVTDKGDYEAWIEARDFYKVAQAIHAILPPVPKVPSLERLYQTVFPWVGPTHSTDSIIEMVKAIHKAMGGEG